MAFLGFLVLAPLALVLFSVMSVAGTAIGLAAFRDLSRPAPSLPLPGQDPAHRSYLSGPVLRDARHFGLTALKGAYRRLLAPPDPDTADSRFARVWRRQSYRSLYGPLILPPAAVAGGYALGFVTSALLILTATAAHAVVAALIVVSVR
ncbi:MAG TPA: hypothetical protein VF821_00685, partial [Lentzea sp.]